MKVNSLKKTCNLQIYFLSVGSSAYFSFFLNLFFDIIYYFILVSGTQHGG